MTYEAIPAELKDRITAAAQELYEQADCQRFPTVDAVRRHAKADMNSTSAVMREWRKAQQAAPVAVAVAVPEAVAAASTAALAAIWQQAQDAAAKQQIADLKATAGASQKAAQEETAAARQAVEAAKAEREAATVEAATATARLAAAEKQAADLLDRLTKAAAADKTDKKGSKP